MVVVVMTMDVIQEEATVVFTIYVNTMTVHMTEPTIFLSAVREVL